MARLRHRSLASPMPANKGIGGTPLLYKKTFFYSYEGFTFVYIKKYKKLLNDLDALLR